MLAEYVVCKLAYLQNIWFATCHACRIHGLQLVYLQDMWFATWHACRICDLQVGILAKKIRGLQLGMLAEYMVCHLAYLQNMWFATLHACRICGLQFGMLADTWFAT
jgi:tetrahydromethanopterin S-methyltransferase subunit F